MTSQQNILSGDEEKLKAWIASLPDNDKRGVSKSTLSKLAEMLHKVLSDDAKIGNYSETETPSSAETIVSTATETGEKLGVKLTDADLRYILWRSHENMTENGRRGVFGEAKDAAMREKLGVNNASEELNERFSEREEEGSDRSLFEQQLLALDKLAESHKENLNIRRMAIEAMNGQMKVSAIFSA